MQVTSIIDWNETDSLLIEHDPETTAEDCDDYSETGWCEWIKETECCWISLCWRWMCSFYGTRDTGHGKVSRKVIFGTKIDVSCEIRRIVDDLSHLLIDNYLLFRL